ncbi:MAG: T9SS type A sorting domain-containing protein [Bacteroidetes bacterium]|nr:T9SS type A sorting domain-containing protein [Bacteroidota bacterium]
MIRRLQILLAFIGLSLGLSAQDHTVGLLSYKPSKAFDGYNLIYPHNQPNVYLLDNCGEIVHVWEDDADFRPGNTAYLLENGNLVKTKRPSAVAGNPIWAGGGGAIIEIRSWDNELLWSFTRNDEFERLHHDIEILPNGNILAICWELKTDAEAIQAGRDPDNLPDGELWPDYILEIEPVGTDEFNIVWEWHTWDHLIQDFDATKDNFGVVADNPFKIDINYTPDGADDWMHTNAIAYHPDLQQIVISVPTFDELWIIDHTTTTQEAAGSTGGQSGRGGDLMYRYGNPQTYDRGTEDDKVLFYQHDTHWALEFLEIGHPMYGKMAVFNNRVGEDFSSANAFDPPWDMYEWEYTLDGDTYGPANFSNILYHPEDPTKMYSTGLSSVQYLPNGNTLICTGRFGYLFEVTPNDEIVWEYKTPLNGGLPATQGDTLEINNNLTFRVKRYPNDFAAFDGKDLSPQGWLELEPDEDFCQTILPTSEAFQDYKMEVYPNPGSDMITLEWEGMPNSVIEVFDLTGRRMLSMEASGGRKYINVSEWEAGMYIIRVDGKGMRTLVVTH